MTACEKKVGVVFVRKKRQKFSVYFLLIIKHHGDLQKMVWNVFAVSPNYVYNNHHKMGFY